MTLQTLQLTKRRFTVTQYEQMAEAGILTEDDRVELIDGEIVEMMAIGHTHAATVRCLISVFFKAFGDSAQVDAQNPVHLDEYNEPQPDVELLVDRPGFYRSGHPEAADVLLFVEVDDSSVEVDRKIKIPLYARASIPEVWLVDLNDNAIIVYRNPAPEGYRTTHTARRGDWISPLAFPGREIAVAAILG